MAHVDLGDWKRDFLEKKPEGSEEKRTGRQCIKKDGENASVGESEFVTKDSLNRFSEVGIERTRRRWREKIGRVSFAHLFQRGVDVAWPSKLFFSPLVGPHSLICLNAEWTLLGL